MCSQWRLFGDGTEFESGTLSADGPIRPRSEDIITVCLQYFSDAATKPRDGRMAAEYWLDISFCLKSATAWGDAGHEIAWEQIHLPVVNKQKTPARLAKEESNVALILAETDDHVTVTTEDKRFCFVLAKKDGAITHFVFTDDPASIDKTESLFLLGPALNAWRTPTDNDMACGEGQAR